MTTPLFHTSFLPDLIQVNFLPALVLTKPAFEQAAPALTAAEAGTANAAPKKAVAITSVSTFFIAQSLP